MRLAWYQENDGWLFRDGDRVVGRVVRGLCNWYLDGDDTPYALPQDAAAVVEQRCAR